MKIVSWGANTYGQLGQSFKSEQVICPSEVSVVNKSLKPEYVTHICGGGGHTLLLDKEGQVFCCGSNLKGQLGVSECSEVYSIQQIPVTFDNQINYIACGWEASFALTCEGKLYVWGSNKYGQLGLPNTVEFVCFPVQLTVPPIKWVSSGLRHTAMITTDGDLLVCGSGRKGCLGIIDSTGQPTACLYEPQKVHSIHNVQHVSCGQHHTIALTERGQVYVWGDNKYGQLGLDPCVHPTVFTPLELPAQVDLKEFFQPYSTVLCGWTHTAVLTDGMVVNWGRNCYGQLGCNSGNANILWKPQILRNIGRIKNICIGSEHNLALMDTGQLMSWGWNEHGNCGTRTVQDVKQPTSVAINTYYEASVIGAGAGHCYSIVTV